MKGNTTGDGVLGGDRPYEQEYAGLNLMYKRRFSNNWDMFASYSYYKAWGVSPSFMDGGSQGYTMYASRGEADPNSYLNIDKTLNSDRRHIFRVVGELHGSVAIQVQHRGQLPDRAPVRPARVGPHTEPRLVPDHCRAGQQRPKVSRPVPVGSQHRQALQSRQGNETSASTCRFSTSSTTTLSSGGVTKITPTTRSRFQKNGSCRAGPSCA